MSRLRFDRAAITHIGPADEGVGSRIAALAGVLPDVRFIVVADSPGGAAEALRACAYAPDNVQHLQMDVPLGKGAALRVGFNATMEDAVCFLSVEGLVDPEQIRTCFDALMSTPGADGVLGNRFDRRGSYSGNARRHLCSRLLNGIGRALFGLRVGDPQSPVKMFRRQAMLRVFEDLRLYNHGFDIELLFQARRQGLRLVEVPIDWTARAMPVLKTGVNAVVALGLLRALYSPLRYVPFIDLLCRKYYVPTKRSYSIMLFCWRDPCNPLAGAAKCIFRSRQSAGSVRVIA